MIFKILKFLMTIMLIVWCGLLESADLNVNVENLLDAPNKITINDQEYTLKTSVIRSQESPILPGEEGGFSYVIVRIKPNSDKKISQLIDVDKLWVIVDGKASETKFNDKPTVYENKGIERIAIEALPSGTFTSVNIVVSVVYRYQRYLIKAANQPVQRIY